MNYEEKYKQALKRAKRLYEQGTITESLGFVFPELIEIESEKIREEIIAFLRSKNGYMTPNEDWDFRNRWLAWLEKQGEHNQTWKPSIAQRIVIKELIEDKNISNVHKTILRGMLDEFKQFTKHEIEKQGESTEANIEIPFGANDSELQEVSYDIPEGFYAEIKDGRVVIKKVEPKFKVGDWVVSNNNGEVWQIGARYTDEGQRIYLYNVNDVIMPITLDELNYYHLWSINDARDGDVLAYVTDEEDLWIMIYRSLYEPYEGHVHYHALLVNDNFSDKGTCCICIDNLIPATKEQRDLLFQKMAEESYVWDSEKKELKEI